jgi:hypothetical protein
VSWSARRREGMARLNLIGKNIFFPPNCTENCQKSLKSMGYDF